MNGTVPVGVSGRTSLRVRPLAPAEVLDDALLLVRARFGSFLKVSVLGYVPIAAPMWIVVSQMQATLMELEEKAPRQSWQFVLILSAVLAVDVLLVRQFVRGVLIHSGAAAYRGEHLSMRRSVSRSLRRLPGAAVTTLLASGLSGLATLLVSSIVAFNDLEAGLVALGVLAVIPLAVVVGIATYVAIPVVHLEGRWPLGAVGRSLHLVSGSLNATILVAVVTTIAGIGIGMLSAFIELVWLQAALSALISSVVLIFETACELVLYFSMRAEQEHLDLDLLAREVAIADAQEVEVPAVAPLAQDLSAR